jgi:hypothetical protein
MYDGYTAQSCSNIFRIWNVSQISFVNISFCCSRRRVYSLRTYSGCKIIFRIANTGTVLFSTQSGSRTVCFLYYSMCYVWSSMLSQSNISYQIKNMSHCKLFTWGTYVYPMRDICMSGWNMQPETPAVPSGKP